MKIGIMQPYFLPYIGYFQLINAVDKFIVYDDVNYIKQGWINKNNFLSNNAASTFIIPLDSPSSFVKIRDTKINSKQFDFWKVKILKTLKQNYKRAPYFDECFDLFSDIINVESFNMSISKLNYLSLIKISNYLEINTEIIESSIKYNNSNLKSKDRIIDICLKENASVYINPIGGIDLYNKIDFNELGIDLFFIKTDKINYNQFNDNFISSLSIIDVLMFNSADEIKKMLDNYELI